MFAHIDGTLVLGFGHKARHGKDWCCQAIHEQFPHMTRLYSFAGALKAYCRVCRGMTKKDGPLLQRVGTDELRAADPLVWVRTLYWQIEEERPRVALISDLRFPNEADFIHSTGGRCVKVSRLQSDGTPFVAPDRDPTHLSETALDDYRGWDATITALSGHTKQLEQQAVQVFHDLVADACLIGQDPTPNFRKVA